LIYKNVFYVSNAGDSRAILCSAGKPIELSIDHKPEVESESDRILKANGEIIEGRINGNLNLSRAIGDL
jgi:serine/threonine protein phosphatase PrpC